MSRVELFERIRREYRDEGVSIRGLAERHRVHRRTVREAVRSAVPAPRKTPVRAASALGGHEATIRRWLTEDLSAPRKQRHTARRVWQRLRGEHGAEVAESTVRGLWLTFREADAGDGSPWCPSTAPELLRREHGVDPMPRSTACFTESEPEPVRAFVAAVRAELAGQAKGVTIGQEHGPGEEAEVDFGEFHAEVGGVALRLWLFVMRLSHSGRGFAVAFAHQAQEAFFEGHVRAFAHFGGVPAGRIRYDNLKPAVTRILLGRDRVENERFIALRSHSLLTELPTA
jgi:hypothetical protein